MSFFDEVDEPRTQPRRRRPSGTGRRPPGDQQSIQARRGVAAGALLIVVVLIAIGVHSCQGSAANAALKDYTNNVSALIQESDGTGSQLFQTLSSGASSTTATSLQNNINKVLANAQKDLTRAQGLSAPDPVKPAQQYLVLTMRMRANGISTIASQIQPALGTSTSKDAINAIAGATAQFYGSDVVYKDYITTAIAGALHAAGIAVGAPNGESISGGQFVPDVQWVIPSFIAAELHVSLPATRSGKVAPGLHGHSLDSVSVAGTTLQTASTNSIAASPPPTFTLNFTNGGTNNETNVVCSVTLSGTSVSGEKIVPETFAGQHGSCQVTLKSSPSPGTQTVVANIQKVPGEKNISNNSLSFPVTFK